MTGNDRMTGTSALKLLDRDKSVAAGGTMAHDCLLTDDKDITNVRRIKLPLDISPVAFQHPETVLD